MWRELICKDRKPISSRATSAQTSGKIAVQIGISIARFIDKNEIKRPLCFMNLL